MNKKTSEKNPNPKTKDEYLLNGKTKEKRSDLSK
jgi:hypothetical protein